MDASNPVPPMQAMQLIATALFVAAVAHTFFAHRLHTLAGRYASGSIRANVLELLGEIEVVFGLWSVVFLAIWAGRFGMPSALYFLENEVNFSEAVFVFVIMCVSATRPVIYYAGRLITSLARILPLPQIMAEYASILVIGPLLGSLITEPAAMTVTGMLLLDRFYSRSPSMKLRYASLGLLFVNISIGGTLTHFAAPPVIMVAASWGWDSAFMLQHFGWRALLAIVVGTSATLLVFRREFAAMARENMAFAGAGAKAKLESPPVWLLISHLAFMALVVTYAHHQVFILALFLLFVAWWTVTREHQTELKVRESLLVACFLAGLVILGNLQGWWIKPLLQSMQPLELFVGGSVLTAFTDNAALTYLATLVPDLSSSARYMLVAGAVVGGGLTVIANAPNPVGYGILQASFGEDGIHPLKLMLAALPYTLAAAVFFIVCA